MGIKFEQKNNKRKVKSIMSPIIKRIFSNDKKYNIKKNETNSRLRLYSALRDKYRNGNVTTNNNITKIIWEYSQKGKYFLEYRNQINK